MNRTFPEVLFCIALGLNAALLWLLFRTLSFHPAPALRPRSLRRSARVLLRPSRRARWWALWAEFGAPPARALGPYLLLAATLFIPALARSAGANLHGLYFGPFDDGEDSREFMQTLWQVVAAAVGLSVAMIAFAFEVFVNSPQSQLGGSLRTFARQTKLLTAIRLGVLALLMDGAVLLELGVDAPGGWAAIWATAVSALTLVWVLVVLERTIRSLGRRSLLALRSGHLREIVADSVRRQLLSQASEQAISEQGPLIERRWLSGEESGTPIRARREGVVVDVRLGWLARIATRTRERRVELAVGLGSKVGRGAEVLSIPDGLSPTQRWVAERAIRIAAGGSEEDLDGQIRHLHAIAQKAIREHQVDEWREIGDLYELALLALPRATAEIGIPFAGAVAAPGFLGYGPMQRISANLRDEMRLALEVDDGEIADALSYLPYRVATEAAALGALALFREMVGLYPALFAMAKQVKPDK
jgi:hypothetical protein